MSCYIEDCDCIDCQRKRGKVFSTEELVALSEEENKWKVGKYPVLGSIGMDVEFPIGSRFYCKVNNFEAKVFEVVESPYQDQHFCYHTPGCQELCDLYDYCHNKFMIECSSFGRSDFKNVYYKEVKDDD